MDPTLDSNLLDTPLGASTKAEISTEFWGDYHGQRFQAVDFGLAPFWAYYSRECSHALHDGGRHIATRKHSDIIDVVRQIKAGVERENIKKSLRSKLTMPHPNEDELLDNSIDLAASLLLMCDCGSSPHGFSGTIELQWEKGTLREFLADYFGEKPVLSHEKVKLEQNFIARNLDRIAGVDIIWTNNLVDHLRFTNDDTQVHIFHHASFLECQRQSTESLLPPALAIETLQTLALLFPTTDRETREWFSRLPSLDQRAAQCGRLKTELRQIEKFHFWRDRLVMLKQVFDEAQPKSLKQWWHDRRNGVQWYTFWVAVLVLALTIFFGLIQSIEGALQVYASFKSLSD